ncbi:MAG: type II toxin-antitoxin system VapC family toxin [Balneolaceae bacterium]|nr:MAG: type II toxin-antitoxin system VapC family toxin [Balneolaceae bacterium]
MLVLDTHSLLWHASESENLSEAAREAMASADELAVSAISAWEIGMLISKGCLSLSYDVSVWIDLAGSPPKIRWIDIGPELAVLSTRLPGTFHGDPADRLITATTISLGASLVTADDRIRNYRHVRTIW